MELRVELHDEKARAMLARVDAGVRKAVHDALWRGADELAKDAFNRAPRDMHTLRNSIKGGITQVDYLHFRVSTGTNYARSVEEGRKPGKQPGVATGLMEWVSRKTKAPMGELQRLTYVIARAIGRRGIKPQPFMQPAFESQKDRIVARVQEAARRAAQEAQGV